MEDVGYCSNPDEVRLYPGVPDALRSMKLDGWRIVVVTNQSGVARGYFSEADYEAVAAEVDRQLANLIDATYVSFDGPESGSSRRKPATGMLEEACADLGLDPRASFFIGDKASDIQCGRAVGCTTILVLTGEGKRHLECGADLVCEDLVSAVSAIRRIPEEEGE